MPNAFTGLGYSNAMSNIISALVKGREMGLERQLMQEEINREMAKFTAEQDIKSRQVATDEEQNRINASRYAPVTVDKALVATLAPLGIHVTEGQVLDPDVLRVLSSGAAMTAQMGGQFRVPGFDEAQPYGIARALAGRAQPNVSTSGLNWPGAPPMMSLPALGARSRENVVGAQQAGATERTGMQVQGRHEDVATQTAAAIQAARIRAAQGRDAAERAAASRIAVARIRAAASQNPTAIRDRQLALRLRALGVMQASQSANAPTFDTLTEETHWKEGVNPDQWQAKQSALEDEIANVGAAVFPSAGEGGFQWGGATGNPINVFPGGGGGGGGGDIIATLAALGAIPGVNLGGAGGGGGRATRTGGRAGGRRFANVQLAQVGDADISAWIQERTPTEFLKQAKQGPGYTPQKAAQALLAARVSPGWLKSHGLPVPGKAAAPAKRPRPAVQPRPEYQTPPGGELARPGGAAPARPARPAPRAAAATQQRPTSQVSFSPNDYWGAHVGRHGSAEKVDLATQFLLDRGVSPQWFVKKFGQDAVTVDPETGDMMLRYPTGGGAVQMIYANVPEQYRADWWRPGAVRP